MRIKELREAKGMKQISLAAALGVDQTAISKWESGECHPRADKLLRLAELLNCTIEELLHEETDKTILEDSTLQSVQKNGQ